MRFQQKPAARGGISRPFPAIIPVTVGSGKRHDHFADAVRDRKPPRHWPRRQLDAAGTDGRARASSDVPRP